ncbi:MULTISPECIES: sialidase family protein [unclassified Streptomyces]|uniref:sialidase family protein n=1 Tax=unclassified Streptomyces TaxID=2593676 RepID=UPI00116511E0|nr:MULTISPECIES: sialidase family protein [unclassified Streptomyces]NMI62164.1 laminin G [Streptomyces sp. RLA2-12]QDN61192.1 laminin G [Streptomyces sp. S1D4-20]QDN71246.1 laminin G [Streptomyces sp. S1D4-14]QDO53701.1 laminin G [Streptomyces sp. RLB3-5]QDO63946.1 laminin G [Streptomyces sp. RLB1-8]
MSARLRARLRSTLTAVLTAAALCVLALPSPARASATDASGASGASFEQQVLFRASQDPGYACFRIPAVVRSTHGTLLAFAEGRVHDCGDAGDIDIVVKRSTDGGRTWGPLQVVNEGAGDTHGNPAPIVDRETGRIVLAETYNTGRTDGRGCDVPCDRTPHLQYSDDDGLSWSAPRDLSAEILPPNWNSWYATGPVHGIQLTRGRHAGRLVFGVNTETWNGSRVTANNAALITSDDGGDHWRIGASDSWPIAQDGTFRQKPSELTLTERADGSVLVSGREQDGTDLGHRTQTVSRDGGDSFTAPFRDLPGLYAPQVQGSVLRLGDRVLLACPGDPDRRRTMMIRSSYDGGRTWDSVDRGTVVTTDWSGYSDLVGIGDGAVGLLYEGGAVDARDEVRFARFTEDWLTPRRGPDPTTDDLARHAEPAAVLGDARGTAGVRGGALEFDGVDDAVRLPYQDRLPLGTKDFTASLWFRYTATGGEQPLLWMGGIGTTQPQVWMRAEPASHRITALITTRSGATAPTSASVRTASAYNDGQWHHLALRRGGGLLTLSVDGTAVVAADVPGSVSRNSPFGVHVGQRMDSRAYFTGAIDEVRVHDRVLSDDELSAPPSREVTRDTVLYLPMDQVRGGH